MGRIAYRRKIVDCLAIGQQHDPKEAVVCLGDRCPSTNAAVGLNLFAKRMLDYSRDPIVEYAGAVCPSTCRAEVGRLLHR
jgi:hypothetical protein